MTDPSPNRYFDVLRLLARLVLGGLFLYMGVSKALHPVEFLKLVRQYDLVHLPWLLNSLAAILPWFEALCGLLLLTGIARRATALISLAMLVPFTILVARRALAIHAAQTIPFCSIKFDCGCGAGEVFICHKLVENSLLILAALCLTIRSDPWLNLWPARSDATSTPRADLPSTS